MEDVGDLKLLVEKRISMFQELNSPAQLLLQFMEQMIEDDVLYLSHIESETEKMEENINETIKNRLRRFDRLFPSAHKTQAKAV